MIPTGFYFEILRRILILNKKLQSHFFAVTETLNSDKYSDVTAAVGKTPPYGCAKSENLPDAKNSHSTYTITMRY